MLKELDITKKLIVIIALFGVFMLLAYKFSFSKTMELKSEFERKQAMVNNLGAIQSEIDSYEKLLASTSISLENNDLIQNQVLERVSDFCKNSDLGLTIAEFSPLHRYEMDNKFINTCSFSVKGGFKGLLRLNEELEKNLSESELSSVEYKREDQNRKKQLIATYYVQSISGE